MVTVLAQPAWDLPTLNTFVADQENFLRGPLTKIGNDGASTTLDIDDLADDKPETNAVITLGPPPAGATKINTDSIFVSGVLVIATAYRP